MNRDGGGARCESVACDDEELRCAVCCDCLAVDCDGGCCGQGVGGLKGDGGAADGDVGVGWGKADGCTGYGDCRSAGRECLAGYDVVGGAVGGDEVVSDCE